MTLIVGLRGKDGLVLAADSRGTIGDPRGLTAINDGQTKLFELSKFCGIGISGSSELAAKIVDELRATIKQKNHEYTDNIVEETRTLVRSRYDDWFSKFSLPDRPPLLFTICGFQPINDNDLLKFAKLLDKVRSG